ncbi:MAG: hypothetical protein KJO69_05740 [Gammaproteobacteria bacterium]|nr:hypothetical protein [Gammaproteobacteria bacterium]
MKKTNLVVDLSNIVHAKHFTLLKKNKQQFNKDLLLFRTIQSIAISAKKFKADGILVACDSKNVWRYDIYPEYKGNRDDLRDPYYPQVKETMGTVKDFFNEYTGIPALSVERAEADDIIASVAQNSKHNVIIMSSDTDFVQLLKNDNVTLYSPSQDIIRTSEDPDFDLFVKIIRGDKTDNIDSAFPRVRIKRLETAWKDKYEMINLMETTMKDRDDKRVKELYKFNERLIDLTRQPAYVKRDIENSINNLNINSYNSIGVMRFIGENNLKGVSKEFLMHKDVFNKHFILNEGDSINARSRNQRQKKTLLHSKTRRSQ